MLVSCVKDIILVFWMESFIHFSLHHWCTKSISACLLVKCSVTWRSTYCLVGTDSWLTVFFIEKFNECGFDLRERLVFCFWVMLEDPLSCDWLPSFVFSSCAVISSILTHFPHLNWFLKILSSWNVYLICLLEVSSLLTEACVVHLLLSPRIWAFCKCCVALFH